MRTGKSRTKATKDTDPHQHFERYLHGEGLRATEERRMVLDVIVSREGHFDADELLQFLRRRRKPVSRATLYRTLDHLIGAGLVKKHSFGRGHAQYEYAFGRMHHDHMVCDRCGRVIEFVNERIELLQNQVCEEHGFRATHHVMEIFGVCRECASEGR